MIATHQLGLEIGGRALLRGLDWQARRGECWSIIGRNGAGKSTLMRTLAGLRAPDAGSVAIEGRAVDAWPPTELAHLRAYLPQARHDAFSYSVLETVLSARHPYHGNRFWEAGEDRRIAFEALARLDAARFAARDVRSLSGGERQRVAIAALLAQDTPLLLLDEPAGALDLAHQVSITRLLARLCRDEGKTAIVIGHDLNLAHALSTHVLLLMGDGRWHAGPVASAMQPALLGDYLGHPIEMIEHGGRRIFIPLETTA